MSSIPNIIKWLNCLNNKHEVMSVLYSNVEDGYVDCFTCGFKYLEHPNLTPKELNYLRDLIK